MDFLKELTKGFLEQLTPMELALAYAGQGAGGMGKNIVFNYGDTYYSDTYYSDTYYSDTYYSDTYYSESGSGNDSETSHSHKGKGTTYYSDTYYSDTYYSDTYYSDNSAGSSYSDSVC